MMQATAEQIRLAQVIYDKNDADFEDKVNQVRSTLTFTRQSQCKLSIYHDSSPLFLTKMHI